MKQTITRETGHKLTYTCYTKILGENIYNINKYRGLLISSFKLIKLNMSYYTSEVYGENFVHS